MTRQQNNMIKEEQREPEHRHELKVGWMGSGLSGHSDSDSFSDCLIILGLAPYRGASEYIRLIVYYHCRKQILQNKWEILSLDDLCKQLYKIIKKSGNTRCKLLERCQDREFC